MRGRITWPHWWIGAGLLSLALPAPLIHVANETIPFPVLDPRFYSLQSMGEMLTWKLEIQISPGKRQRRALRRSHVSRKRPAQQ